MARTPREFAVKVLRAAGLNRVAARVYYRVFHGFGFASEGKELPSVVRRLLSGVDRTVEQHFYQGQYACSLEQVQMELDRRGDWRRSAPGSLNAMRPERQYSRTRG